MTAIVRYCEKVYGRSGGGLLEAGVMFKIDLELGISMRPVCLLMIFLLFTLNCLVV